MEYFELAVVPPVEHRCKMALDERSFGADLWDAVQMFASLSAVPPHR